MITKVMDLLQRDKTCTCPKSRKSTAAMTLLKESVLIHPACRLCTLRAAAAAKSPQSWPTLCDPIDGSPPGSPIPGILQARTWEWVAISYSHAWKWKVNVKSLSRVRLFVTLWIAAHQAPPPMGFSRQEYWSGVPLPSPSWGARIYVYYVQL